MTITKTFQDGRYRYESSGEPHEEQIDDRYTLIIHPGGWIETMNGNLSDEEVERLLLPTMLGRSLMQSKGKVK